MSPDYAPLWYWVRERERIRAHKASKGLPPHTDDPILAKFRFCNVRREDDRVTVWIRENIRKPFAGHQYLWLMLCIARQINLPACLGDLIAGEAWPEPGDAAWLDRMQHVMNRRALDGDRVYTGAYTITAPPQKGASKVEFTCRRVIGQLWRDRQKFTDYLASDWRSLQGMHALLKKYTAWGDFMAYQAVVDMRFTALLDDARDRATWAAAGPGTLRGLNRLHGRKLETKVSQAQALSELLAIYATAERETGVAMDLSDVPNILCETDKYLRVKNGEGTPRQLYVPFGRAA